MTRYVKDRSVGSQEKRTEMTNQCIRIVNQVVEYQMKSVIHCTFSAL